MNQILVSEKVYVTPKLVRKKKIYKFQFIFCVIAVIILTASYACTEYDKIKSEKISQDILNNIYFSDRTTVDQQFLVIALEDDEPTQVTVQEPENIQGNNQNVYTSPNGIQYTVDAVLNIPSLGINYPVLTETSDDLLKISLNKFWGGKPNEVGNYCIVGHNYDGKDIFFGKLNKIKNGDIVELEDTTGRKLSYKVYNIFIVEPTDVACTSQLTNGKTEMTLITCAEGGKTRLIVKCRAI